ncbi:MAG: hypothetical protein U7126_06035 [Microcoleus sp.]
MTELAWTQGWSETGFFARRRATARINGKKPGFFGIENTAMSDKEMPFP